MDIDTLGRGGLCEACACEAVPAVVQAGLCAELTLVEGSYIDSGGRTVGLINDNHGPGIRRVAAEVDIAAHRLQTDGILFREATGIIPFTLRHIPDIPAVYLGGTERADKAVASGVGQRCRGLHLLHGHTRESDDLPEVVLRPVGVSYMYQERRTGGNGAANRHIEVDIAVIVLLDQAVDGRIAEGVGDLGRRHVERQAEHVPGVDVHLSVTEPYVIRPALCGGGVDYGCQVLAVVERQYLYLRLSAEHAAQHHDQCKQGLLHIFSWFMGLSDNDLAALMDIDALSGGSLRQARARQGVPAVILTSLPVGRLPVEAGHLDDTRDAGIIDDDLRPFHRGVAAEVEIAAQRLQRKGFLF